MPKFRFFILHYIYSGYKHAALTGLKIYKLMLL